MSKTYLNWFYPVRIQFQVALNNFICQNLQIFFILALLICCVLFLHIREWISLKRTTDQLSVLETIYTVWLKYHISLPYGHFCYDNKLVIDTESSQRDSCFQHLFDRYELFLWVCAGFCCQEEEYKSHNHRNISENLLIWQMAKT